MKNLVKKPCVKQDMPSANIKTLVKSIPVKILLGSAIVFLIKTFSHQFQIIMWFGVVSLGLWLWRFWIRWIKQAKEEWEK